MENKCTSGYRAQVALIEMFIIIRTGKAAPTTGWKWNVVIEVIWIYISVSRFFCPPGWGGRQAGQQELLGPYNNDDDYHIVVICYSSEWMNQLYMNTYRGREREIVDQNKIDSHRITTAMTSDQHHHHHQRAAANERKPELMPSTDWWMDCFWD